MSEQGPGHILVIDDEEFNRDILQEYLLDAGYHVTLACDGEDAWGLLKNTAQDYDIVLLDRMMPELDGIGLLKRIKADPRLCNIPVIFQTAMDSPQYVNEGLEAGAFYYLTKPFTKEAMLTIVQSAISDYAMAHALRGEVVLEKRWSDQLQLRSEFRLRTLSDARHLAATLARFFPEPQRVLLGLSELMINAVEHGNLRIGYHEKAGLLQAGKWEGEIERRLALPENAAKDVYVLMERTSDEIRVTVTDCGEGFDWRKYLEISAERAFDPNGRGIAMSKMMSFDTLEYVGKGNQAVARVKLPVGAREVP